MKKRVALVELQPIDWEAKDGNIIFGQSRDKTITNKTIFRIGKIIPKRIQYKKGFALPLTNVPKKDFNLDIPVDKRLILSFVGTMMQQAKNKEGKKEEFYFWLLLASLIEKGEFGR